MIAGILRRFAAHPFRRDDELMRQAITVANEQRYWQRQRADRGEYGLAWAAMNDPEVHSRFIRSPLAITTGARNDGWGSYSLLNTSAVLDRIGESPAALAILHGCARP